MDCLISEYCCIPNKLLWHIYKIIFALHPDDAFFILFSVVGVVWLETVVLARSPFWLVRGIIVGNDGVLGLFCAHCLG